MSVTTTMVPTVDQSHSVFASTWLMRTQPCDCGVPSRESGSIGRPLGSMGIPWKSIGLPLVDTANRSVHGSVKSPDGELGTFEYTWWMPALGRPCRPDTKNVCDTRPFASTVHTRCCAFE